VPADPTTVAVVLPTYNERENVEAIVAAVTRHGYRVMVVDDASPDGTGELADRLAGDNPLVAVLHRHAKEGLGPAYAHGFREAVVRGATIVCEMDADFSHDPDALPALVKAVDEGADLAIGSRYVDGGSTPEWPLHRRLLSRGGNLYAKWMLGLSVNDATAGFRAYRSETVSRLRADTCLASGYAFQVEMAWRASQAGMSIEEVPITFRDRTAGTSKMGLRIVLEAMWLVTKWGCARRLGKR
jgi:dolichol-phosphate mannosyltransferase